MAGRKQGEAILVHENPRSTMAEAMRRLKTNLKYVSVDREVKVVAVTSSVPQEGKSTIASNLAMVFAQAGDNVLLVDGDMRKPKLHEVFKLEDIVGLSNLITDTCELEDLVHKTQTGVSVLLSGPLPPNPVDLLITARMKEIVNQARQSYEFVIIDTPSVAAVSDALIISTLVDGTLVVVAHGRTKRDVVQKSVEGLRKVRGNVLGVVLNKVPGENEDYQYYHYYTK